MIMTAKEAMLALLDGKTLERDDPRCLIKLDDKGNLVACHTKDLLEKGEFRDIHTQINTMNRIYEEYPLDFEQALRAMLDGKVVEVKRLDPNLRFRYRFGHDPPCFEFYNSSDDKWWMTRISECEQCCKWKVVE